MAGATLRSQGSPRFSSPADSRSPPRPTVLREDPTAFDGIPEELIDSPAGGLSVRSWFATLTGTRARRLPRWQDRYAAAAAYAPSARLALERLLTAL